MRCWWRCVCVLKRSHVLLLLCAVEIRGSNTRPVKVSCAPLIGRSGGGSLFTLFVFLLGLSSLVVPHIIYFVFSLFVLKGMSSLVFLIGIVSSIVQRCLSLYGMILCCILCD